MSCLEVSEEWYLNMHTSVGHSGAITNQFLCFLGAVLPEILQKVPDDGWARMALSLRK